MSRVIHFGWNPDPERVVRFGELVSTAGSAEASVQAAASVQVHATDCQLYRDTARTQQPRAWAHDGDLYTSAWDVNAGDNRLATFRSTDDGATWSRVDQADEFTLASDLNPPLSAVASRLIGDSLWVGTSVWRTSSAWFSYIVRLDLVSQTYDAPIEIGAGPSGFSTPEDPGSILIAERTGDAYIVNRAQNETADHIRVNFQIYDEGGVINGATELLSDESAGSVNVFAADIASGGHRHHFYNRRDAGGGVAFVERFTTSQQAEVSLAFDGAPADAVAIDSDRVACLFREDATGLLKVVVIGNTGTSATYTSALVCRGTDLERPHAAMDFDGADRLRILYMGTDDALHAAEMATSDGAFTDLGAVTGDGGTTIDANLAGYNVASARLAHVADGADAFAPLQVTAITWPSS